MIEKLISGGQTGADIAALDVALKHDFPHGGWCPKGRRCEVGIIPPQYKLVETPSSDYLQRTEWNVRDSDGTLVFTFGANVTGGSLKTISFAKKHRKPLLHVWKGSEEPNLKIQKFILDNEVKVLNVAGSRESKEPGICKWVTELLSEALFREEDLASEQGRPMIREVKEVLWIARQIEHERKLKAATEQDELPLF